MLKYEDQELQQAAHNLIHNFKNLSGSNWEAYFNEFPKDLQIDLKQKYGI